jgi:predicted Fe-S protein YdhL (DUF1289 family)
MRHSPFTFHSHDHEHASMSVKSPCIDICKFDSKTGYCVGCLRTKEECKGWKKMKDKHRRKVIDQKPERAAMIRK